MLLVREREKSIGVVEGALVHHGLHVKLMKGYTIKSLNSREGWARGGYALATSGKTYAL